MTTNISLNILTMLFTRLYSIKHNYMNIEIDDSIPDSLVFELTDHSYELVVNSLAKLKKEQLKKLKNKSI